MDEENGEKKRGEGKKIKGEERGKKRSRKKEGKRGGKKTEIE